MRNAFNECLRILHISIYLKTIVLSTKHTPENEYGKNIIQNAGGQLLSAGGAYRVDGIFPLTRAIGIDLSDFFLVGCIIALVSLDLTFCIIAFQVTFVSRQLLQDKL